MTQGAVIQKLLSITHEDVWGLLDAKQSTDSVVGIAIVHLLGLEATNTQGLTYHFHAARVFASSSEAPNYVTPHYHLKGEEPYHILAGDGGEMNLGKVVDGRVAWQVPRLVKAGEVIEVQEAEVHSLRNTSDSVLDFTFACPDEHLLDYATNNPAGDRYVTKGLDGATPPHYPV